MKGFKLTIATTAGAIVLASTLVATPAVAAQGKNLGARSCSVGVASEVRASGSQRHDINADYKTFPYSASYVTRNFYPGFKVANSSYAQVSGAISSGRLFCDY